MKLLILGATGRTGEEVLKEALKRQISVQILVRDRRKVKFESPDLTIIESSTINELALRRAMQGCDAIISTLNIARTSDFPWSPLRTPKTFLSDTLRTILSVADELPLKRLIITSAWGVNETKNDIPRWFRWMIENSNINVAYQDHERQENLLMPSSLQWTVVRPAGLTNFRNTKKIRVTRDNVPAPNLLISRRNVAKFLLDTYQNNQFCQQVVTISEE